MLGSQRTGTSSNTVFKRGHEAEQKGKPRRALCNLIYGTLTESALFEQARSLSWHFPAMDIKVPRNKTSKGLGELWYL